MPLTCQWCRNQPAAQLIVVDWPSIGRRTSLVCDSCGDRTRSDVQHADVILFRYRLTPIKEKADA
ncbi:hypothetical protein ACBJ32_16930 [Nonomuraea sp. GTA35]